MNCSIKPSLPICLASIIVFNLSPWRRTIFGKHCSWPKYSNIRHQTCLILAEKFVKAQYGQGGGRKLMVRGVFKFWAEWLTNVWESCKVRSMVLKPLMLSIMVLLLDYQRFICVYFWSALLWVLWFSQEK